MVEKNENDSEEIQDSDDDIEAGQSDSDTDAGDEEEEMPQGKKRPFPAASLKEDNGESKKKKIKKQLLKPPTAEEMTHLRETENLFHSNLFRLEIEEMMKEVHVKEKQKKKFQLWFSQLKAFFSTLKQPKEISMSDAQLWLKKLSISLPVQLDLKKYPFTFQFIKPSSVSIVGSFSLETCLSPGVQIDINVQMPKAVFLRSDFQNQKYLVKRALYLSYVASKLSNSSLADEVEFSFVEGDPWKPCVLLKSASLGKHLSVQLLFTPQQDTFKMSQLGPDKANIKGKWATGIEDDVEMVSPFYNRSVGVDMASEQNEQWLQQVLQGQKGVVEGVMMLKVWLKQRGLDKGYGAFGPFIMSMYVAHLLKTRKLSPVMSSYQVVRNTWNCLAREDWTNNGITLSPEADGPCVDDFHLLFDVVFVDTTGYVNLAGNMSKSTFFQVKRESAVAVKCLDNHNINSFSALFMTKMPFYRQFDHIISFDSAAVKKAKQQLDSPGRLDVSGPWFVHQDMVSVLSQGLGQRVQLLGVQLPSTPTWSIVDSVPDAWDRSLVLGLTLDPDHALTLLTKGPAANLLEAKIFRDFWGDKSELRRFQDGSVCEAVLWTAGGVATRRLVCREVVRHVALKHLGLDPDAFLYVANQFESILELSTGEDGALSITKSCDVFGRQLMQLEGLPLDIASVQGASPVLRYSDPFPPLPFSAPARGKFGSTALKTRQVKSLKSTSPVEVIVSLALSSKWPDDLEAVQRIKAAFYIKIGEALKKQLKLVSQPHPSHIDVLKDGFVFRLTVYHAREISLMKETTSAQGVTKYKDNDLSLALELKYVHQPKLTSILHGLHMSYPSLGGASCLAKRWVSSHMLLDDSLMPETCVELLMASIYLSPEPYQPPVQPQTAFLRFLQMLTKAPWTSEPIILNFGDQIKRPEAVEIENKFNSERSTLPALFIVTPETRSGITWTKKAPTKQILFRLTQLASASLQTIDKELLANENFDYKVIFRTPMNIFDVVINLQKQYTRKEESLDGTQDARPVASQQADFIPIVQLDLVQCFLRDLRDTYSDYALFFCDRHGGNQIGVLFKPDVFGSQDFKVSHANGHIPKPQKSMEFSKDVFVDDVKVLGEGIITSISMK